MTAMVDVLICVGVKTSRGRSQSCCVTNSHLEVSAHSHTHRATHSFTNQGHGKLETSASGRESNLG